MKNIYRPKGKVPGKRQYPNGLKSSKPGSAVILPDSKKPEVLSQINPLHFLVS